MVAYFCGDRINRSGSLLCQPTAMACVTRSPCSLEILTQLAQGERADAAGGRFERVSGVCEGVGVIDLCCLLNLVHLFFGIDQKFIQQSPVHARVVADQLGERAGVPDR